jgi:hypothetical protein
MSRLGASPVFAGRTVASAKTAQSTKKPAICNVCVPKWCCPITLPVTNHGLPEIALRRSGGRMNRRQAQPGMGELSEGFRVPGCRSFRVGNCVIFFRPAEGGVEMPRVMHGSPDMPNL